MAEPTSSTRQDGRDSTNRRRPALSRTSPSTHSARIAPETEPEPERDVLEVSTEPTDETPTTISRNPPRPAQANPRDVRGHRLAHFELIEQIGVGGMAAVLKARDTQLDRAVALKILPPEMAVDPENIRRFHQEARAAAKLDHENVARVFFCGEDQGLHFIAFEFVEGENLRMVMERKGGRLPVGESLSYLIQIAAGLAHAAERGVVHRDIKPSNIIITPAGKAKLVDMGLARSLERQDERSLTHSGVTLGTFDYISPEQALEPRDADERSDIYSLGCTFYHMLTGRPPVPEGTAARKLQHHQHVKPVDPRELVSGLPDAVVLVLNRMLAKRPEDRYQKATQLVLDLLAVARKTGIHAETPEGVLMVESPAPEPGRGRGLLLAGLAVAAVVAIIFGLDTPNTPEPGPSGQTISRPSKPTPGPATGPEVTPNPTQPEVPGSGRDPVPTTVVATYNSESPGAPPFVEWLKANRDAKKLDITLGRDLDLTTRDEPSETGLHLKASQEVILRAHPDRRPTIRLSYDAGTTRVAEPPQTLAALTLDAPKSLIEGVRVIVDSRFSKAELVGLLIRGGDHTVRNCDFFQTQPGYGERRLSSIFVSSGKLDLLECSFLGYRSQEQVKAGEGKPADLLTLKELTDDAGKSGGVDAVVVRGDATLTVKQCVFGPHLAAFYLNGPRDNAGPDLRVDHSTFALGEDSAVFQVGEQTSAKLALARSLVARPGTIPGKSSLLRQRGQATLQATDNRYFGLDAYARAGDVIDIPIEGFAAQLGERSKDDSTLLEVSPWRSEEARGKLDPLTLAVQFGEGLAATNDRAAKTAEEQILFGAFRLDERRGDLRIATPPRDHLIGAERRGALVSKPMDTGPALARRERIVDPTQNDPANGLYPTLEQAIFDARPGDVLLIRYNGVLGVKPQRLEEATIDLTIRADIGWTPILTLAETADAAPVLFQLHDGRLRLENLEIRLQPRRPFKSQAVVAFLGEGLCSLKDCIVTLDPTAQDTTHLSLAVLPDTEGVMRMDPRPVPRTPVPRLALEDCLVRGVGEVVRARVCRPADIDIKNGLFVLVGSVVTVEGKDGVGSSSAPLVLRLTRTTTCTTGHLLHLKAPKGFKLPLSIQVNPTECLFLPGTTATAFLRFEGTELADADKLKERLEWKAARGNAYGNYLTLLEQPAIADDVPLTRETWPAFSGETLAKFAVRLAMNPPTDPAAFLKVRPSQFKPMDLSGVGADVAGLQRSLPAGE